MAVQKFRHMSNALNIEWKEKLAAQIREAREAAGFTGDHFYLTSFLWIRTFPGTTQRRQVISRPPRCWRKASLR